MLGRNFLFFYEGFPINLIQLGESMLLCKSPEALDLQGGFSGWSHNYQKRQVLLPSFFRGETKEQLWNCPGEWSRMVCSQLYTQIHQPDHRTLRHCPCLRNPIKRDWRRLQKAPRGGQRQTGKVFQQEQNNLGPAPDLQPTRQRGDLSYRGTSKGCAQPMPLQRMRQEKEWDRKNEQYSNKRQAQRNIHFPPERPCHIKSSKYPTQNQ